MSRRFDALLAMGHELATKKPDYPGDTYQYEAWFISLQNLISQICMESSPYVRHMREHLNQELFPNQARASLLLGVLSAAHDDWMAGLLTNLDDQIRAETFDNFLDHSTELLASGDHKASGVLAAAVFEDALKRIAVLHGVESKRTAEPLINQLAEKNVFNSVQRKRYVGVVPVRDRALHANWEEYKASDVEALINVAKDLIDTYLNR